MKKLLTIAVMLGCSAVCRADLATEFSTCMKQCRKDKRAGELDSQEVKVCKRNCHKTAAKGFVERKK